MTIRPATATDHDAAAATVAAAFDPYPWTRWAIPQDGYPDRLYRLQRLYLGYALDAGIVLVDDDLRAVIALLPPDAPEPAPDMQREVAALHGDRVNALAATNVPPQPDGAWNLATVGVHPDNQGAGLGGATVEAGLAAVGGAAVALETSDERNVRLYERAGFEVTAITRIEQGPVVYSMLRPAGH